MTIDITYVLIFTNLVIFSLGLIIGRLFSNKTINNINDMVSVNSKKEARNKTQIDIDDTKYVGKISTAGLEKKYDNLGDVKSSDNNIASSVNKLKNLKG